MPLCFCTQLEMKAFTFSQEDRPNIEQTKKMQGNGSEKLRVCVEQSGTPPVTPLAPNPCYLCNAVLLASEVYKPCNKSGFFQISLPPSPAEASPSKMLFQLVSVWSWGALQYRSCSHVVYGLWACFFSLSLSRYGVSLSQSGYIATVQATTVTQR